MRSQGRGKGIAVLGAQWGDEGKGKVADILAAQCDMVVRYQGGANAGHTIIDDAGKKNVLHLMPVGMLQKHCRAALGPGVVLDPAQLAVEIDELSDAGYGSKQALLDRLIVDRSCTLLLPAHKWLDRRTEDMLQKISGQPLGTTGRGVGPAYSDRAARLALRAQDLFDLEHCEQRLQALLKHNGAEALHEESMEVLRSAAADLLPCIADVGRLAHQALSTGQNVLLEGAQGYLLDLTQGSYPYVTSSHTQIAGAALGAGLPPSAVDLRIGIVKAYATRVGTGPFPTELSGTQADRLRQAGGEFGATTGRERRCGWLDMPLLRDAAWRNDLDTLCLTKMDVLEGMDVVRISTGYRDAKGNEVHIDKGSVRWDDLVPQYRDFPGWPKGGVSAASSREDLHSNARAYIEAIEQMAGVKVALISTGARRDAFLGLGEFLSCNGLSSAKGS